MIHQAAAIYSEQIKEGNMGKTSLITTMEQQIREEIQTFAPSNTFCSGFTAGVATSLTDGRNGTIPGAVSTEGFSFLCNRSNTAAWQTQGPGSIPKPLKHFKGRVALRSTQTWHRKATSRQTATMPPAAPPVPGRLSPAHSSQAAALGHCRGQAGVI